MYDMLPSYRKPLWLRALEPRRKRRRLTHREVVETSVAHFAHIPLVFEHPDIPMTFFGHLNTLRRGDKKRVPSGKLLHNYWKSPFLLMGKSTISTGPFSIVKRQFTRVGRWPKIPPHIATWPIRAGLAWRSRGRQGIQSRGAAAP